VSQPQPEPLVTVFVTNAVRTSQVPGPGVKRLPASEAGATVGMKYAVSGDRDRRRGHRPGAAGQAVRQPAAKPTGAVELAGGTRERPHRDPGWHGGHPP